MEEPKIVQAAVEQSSKEEEPAVSDKTEPCTDAQSETAHAPSSESDEEVSKLPTTKAELLKSQTPFANRACSQLKKTCEPCAKSKVKCEGSQPCERCAKRGVECQYLFEQKRGRRMGSSQTPPSVKRARSNDVEDLQARVQHKELLRMSQLQQQQHCRPVYVTSNMAATQRPLMGQGIFRLPYSSELLPPMTSTMSAMQGWQVPGLLNSSSMQMPQIYGQVANSSSIQMPQIYAQAPMVSRPLIQQSSPSFALMPPTQVPYHQAVDTHLSSIQQRMLRTVFAMYKTNHYRGPGNVVRKRWFDVRLSLLWKMLSSKISPDEGHRLVSWFNDKLIPVEAYMKDAMLFANHFSHAIPDFPVARHRSLERNVPKVGQYLGMLQIGFNGGIEVNPELIASFGYSSSDFRVQLPVQGFLPFGADVMCLLASEDQEAYLYLQDAFVALRFAKENKLDRVVWHSKVSLQQKTGVRVDAIVFCEGPLRVNGEEAILTSQDITFFLAPPEHVFTPSEATVLGPWFGRNLASPGSISVLLNWVDSN